jgi:hypothetical protein
MPKTRRYWEEKAAEARVLAETLTGEDNRQVMLQIAQSYERLAAAAVEKESEKRGQPSASDRSPRGV